jgi:hypothetical protein
MIGALSIVRFRNPVKSPFELVIFFALITLGIVNSVSFVLSFLLSLIVVLTIFGIKIGEKILSKIGLNAYEYSFGDGNLNYTIEVVAKKEIIDLTNNKHLINFHYDKEENNYSYRLVFQNRDDLLIFRKSLKDNPDINNIRADMQS